MKTTKSITIEVEVWIKAKQRTDNISNIIETLLESWINTTQPKEEVNQVEALKLEMEKLKAELATKEHELKTQKDRHRVARVLT